MRQVRTQLIVITILFAGSMELTSAHILRIGRNCKHVAVHERVWSYAKPRPRSFNAIMTREEFVKQAKELIKNYKPLIVKVYKPYVPFDDTKGDENNSFKNESVSLFEPTTTPPVKTTTQISLKTAELSRGTEVSITTTDIIFSSSNLTDDELPSTTTLPNTTLVPDIEPDTTAFSYEDSMLTNAFGTTTNFPATSTFNETIAALDHTTEALEIIGETTTVTTTDATPNEKTDDSTTTEVPEVTPFLPTSLSELDESTEAVGIDFNERVGELNGPTTVATETLTAAVDPTEAFETTADEKLSISTTPSETTTDSKTTEGPEATSFLPTALSELHDTTETFVKEFNERVGVLAEQTTAQPDSLTVAADPTTEASLTTAAETTTVTTTTDAALTETTTTTELPEVTSFLPTPLSELGDTTEALVKDLLYKPGDELVGPTTIPTETFADDHTTEAPGTIIVTATAATPSETSTNSTTTKEPVTTSFLSPPISVLDETTLVAENRTTEATGTTTDGTITATSTDTTSTETTTDSTTAELPEVTYFLPTPLNGNDDTTEAFVTEFNERVGVFGGPTTVRTKTSTESEIIAERDPTTEATGTATDGSTTETTTDATPNQTTTDSTTTEEPEATSFLPTHLSELLDTTEAFVKEFSELVGVFSQSETLTEAATTEAPNSATGGSRTKPVETTTVFSTDATPTETKTDSTTTHEPEATSFLPTPLNENDVTTEGFTEDLNEQAEVFATRTTAESTNTWAIETSTDATTSANSLFDETSFVNLQAGNFTNTVAEFIIMRTTLAPEIISDTPKILPRRDNSISSEFLEETNKFVHSSVPAADSQVKPRKITYHTDVIPTLDDLFPLY